MPFIHTGREAWEEESMRGKGWSGMLSVLGFSLFILGWWVVATFSHPLFVPSPWLTVKTAVELTGNGFLQESILMSLGRILSGWLLGSVLGIPLGLFMGWLPAVRTFATPYIQGLRYIPPISFVGIFIVWFGLGEASKIMLVFYTTFFVIVINTMAGTLSASPGCCAPPEAWERRKHRFCSRWSFPNRRPTS